MDLKEQLPFVVEMIESVKTVEFRQKWQTMKDLIESNKLTAKQIETILLNIQKAKQLREQYKKTIVTVVPAPKYYNELQNDSDQSANKSTQPEPSEIVLTKQQKELKRLHENIVKDDSPLPSKRRSALKRSYRDSLEFLLEKSPSRSQEKKSKSEIIEKKSNFLNKRKSDGALDVNSSSRNGTVVPHKKNKDGKDVETIDPAQKSLKFTEKSKLEVNQLPTKPEKVVDLKLPLVPSEPCKFVDPKKSSIDKFKRKIQKHQKKEILKKKNRLNLLTKGAAIRGHEKLDDDEWEDVDESQEELQPKQVSTKDVGRKCIPLVPKQEVSSPSNSTMCSEAPVTKINKLGPLIVKKVQNMSYIPCKSGFLFKCLVQGCKFFTMDNPAFVDHIENEHLSIKWDGQCEICQQQVDKTRSIIFELMHMRENHVLKEQFDVTKLPEGYEKSDTEVEVKKEEKLPENRIEELKKPEATISKLIGQKIEIGKIKLRPLSALTSPPSEIYKAQSQNEPKTKEVTSDYSRSSSSQSDDSAPTGKRFAANTSCKDTNKDKIIKHIIVKPLPKSGELPMAQKANEALEKPAVKHVQNKLKPVENSAVQRQKPVEITPDLLRPWLKRKLKKYLMPTTRFLNNVAAIVASYKCTSPRCSFFTSDKQLFCTHLKLHEIHLPGDRDYMNCAYCDCIFSDTDNPDSLVQHINNEHCYDKYQCKYCFYRSCVSLNVINHQKIFHPMKQKSVYELPIDTNRNYEQELATIKKSRTKFVPPLVCVKCGAKFYLFPKLTAHMQSHGLNIKTKCTKCSEVSDLSNIHKHLINCHKLGLYQCLFCNFGTNTFETIVNHIGSNHPSKPPIYCERSSEESNEANPSTIDSTSMKFLTQQVDHRIIENPKVDEKVLRNEENVGDLGGNVKVKSTVKPDQNKPAPSVQPTTPNQSRKVNKAINVFPLTSTPNNKEKPKPTQMIKQVDGKTSIYESRNPVVERHEAKSPEARVIKIIRKKTGANPAGISNESNSGLQIKSVYSLNSSK